MSIVGIIANPASGKDIRRLVAHGSIFDNNEKVNIVRRLLVGLQAAGVDEVVFMPDHFNIGQKAVNGLHLDMKITTLEVPVRGEQQDSTDAARAMVEMGAGSIITLGGDGTNRAVAKTCGDVPLVPISTGTNNVFPYMIEGTLAGMAAGVIALGVLPVEEVTERTKRLDILRDGELIDIALIDVVVYDEAFMGSRAIWDVSKIRAMVLSRAEPWNIGLSSVGGNLFCEELDARHGVYLDVGAGPLEVTAPVAPGLIDWVGIAGYRRLGMGDAVDIRTVPSILALDGEREVAVRQGMAIAVRLSDAGPRVVNVAAALRAASRLNLFTRRGDRRPADGQCMLLAARVCLAPCLRGGDCCA